MTRYFIEDVKCGYGTCFDGCGPHTTVASAIKYKTDDGETDWIYCVQPEGIWPMIALYDEDVYEEIINGEFDCVVCNAGVSLHENSIVEVGRKQYEEQFARLEGANINIKVIVQGMQYRNTGSRTWEQLFDQTFIIDR